MMVIIVRLVELACTFVLIALSSNLVFLLPGTNLVIIIKNKSKTEM